METLKKLTLMLFVIIFINLVSSSSPPDIPVMVYGKVSSETGSGISQVPVKASWVDKDGFPQFETTTTLTLDQAVSLGSPELLGYYRFDNINAVQGETIRIEAYSITIDVDAIYGIQIKAPEIVVSSSGKATLKNDKSDTGFFESLLNFISDLFDFSSKSSGNLSNEDLEDSDYSGGYDEDNQYTGDYNEDYTGDDYYPSENSGSSSEIGPENVNNEGIEQHDNNDAGILRKGENITYSEYSQRMNSSLGSQEDSESLVNQTLGSLKDNTGFPLWVYLMSIGIFLLILVGIYSASILIKMIKKPSKTLKVSIGKMSSVNSTRFMNKEPVTLDQNSSVIDAVEMFCAKNIGIIPITRSEEPIGILTKMNLLKNLKNYDYTTLEKTKVKEVMQKKFISCRPNQKLGDIYSMMLQSNLNEMVVSERYVLKGTIDFFDILRILSNTDFEIENPPNIGQAINENYSSVKNDTTLQELRNKFINENVEYSLVLKDGKPVGIITIKDIINAIKKGFSLKDTFVQNMMSTRIFSLDPGKKVTDSFKVILEKRFNQIPIFSKDKIIGVVSIKHLVKVYYDFISELKDVKGNFVMDVNELEAKV